MLNTIDYWLSRICRFFIGLSFCVLIASVSIQVLGRTFDSSPVWTEELTRFSLLYLAAIGAGLSFKSGELVNVDVVCDAFGEKWSVRLRFISALLTAVLCGVLIAPAWRFVSIGAMQTSPAMGLQMTYVHFSVFALLLILLIFCVLRLLQMITGNDVQRSTRIKDTD